MLEDLKPTSGVDRLLQRAPGLLDRLLNWLLRPFVDAASLDEYGTTGYKWFGGLLALLVMWGWLSGVLDHLLEVVDFLRLFLPLSQINEAWSQASGLAFLVLLYLTVLYVPWARGVRVWIGRAFADILFNIAEHLISFGEWCIRRRSIAAVLILGLSLVIVTMVFQHNRRLQRHSALSHQFDDWLGRAEELVISTSFTDNPGPQLTALRNTWQSGFPRLSHRRKVLDRTRKGDPATALRAVFSLVAAKDTQSWSTYLREHADTLNSIAASVEWQSEVAQPEQSVRARSILAFMLAKVQIQLAPPDCRDQEALGNAMRFFERISTEGLRVHRENGRGVIYACVLSLLLKDSTMRRNPEPAPICASVSVCASEAFVLFQRTGQLSRGQRSTECSYEQMRSRNNTVDLLTRLGRSYSEHQGRGFRAPLSQVVRTPAELKKQLGTRTELLLVCARSKGTPLPTVFVTASQAYGTIASLSNPGTPEFHAALGSAAAYLQFAYLLQPGNLDDWDLLPLCPAVSAQGVAASFRAGLNGSLHAGTSKNVDTLVGRLEEQCRSNA